MESFVYEILERQYFLKDEKGKLLETSWEDLCLRVAEDISRGESEKDKWRDLFLDLLLNKIFLPNSPTLMNAGSKNPMLAACFVIDVPDRIEDILDAVKVSALIQKYGGGVGYSFSSLRPEGDILRSTGGTASGPLSFLNIFNVLTDTIKQGGKRRGANMGCLKSSHPDIIKFIKAKGEEGYYANFNFSVWIDDLFFKCLKENVLYDLINPNTKKIESKISPDELLDLISFFAWKIGEPGVLFGDRIDYYNPTPHLGKIEATNPCGEQPLLPYEQCNLGSINLMKFVSLKGSFNFDSLEKIARISTRFLDDVIDRCKFPVKKIEERVRGNRKIGLGVLGFADVLLMLGIKYGSPESFELARNIMKVIDRASKEESMRLASEKGRYPNFEGSVFRWLEERYPDLKKDVKKYGLRNATTTTIAPTGTIGILAGVSSGIEPNFGWKVKRKDSFGEHEIYHPLVKDLCDKENLPDYFVTAHDLAYNQHIEMQKAFQDFVDNAVSKTINFPENATKEEIKKAILLAYELGCKGITVYRDGSRRVQVLSKNKNGGLRYRPFIAGGVTIKSVDKEFLWEGKKCLLTVNFDEEKYPVECVITFGKAGKELAANAEGYGRLISSALKYGVPVKEIIKQLRGISSDNITYSRGERYDSLPDFIGKALNEVLQYEVKVEVRRERCPNCETILVYKEGCFSCPSCGFSKCL